MRQFLSHNISWIIFLIALVLLISHVVGWEKITVDTTTLLLLDILLVSPLIEQLRKIKVGEFEAEIAPKEVEKVETEVNKHLGERGTKEITETRIRPEEKYFSDLVERDPILALAEMRLEIERALARLYWLAGLGGQKYKYSGRSLVTDLARSGILPSQLSGPIQDLFSLANRAIHGEYVRKADAKRILEIGTRILEEIDLIIEEFVLKPIETQSISDGDVRSAGEAKYRVTTIVPLVENPIRKVYIFDQEGLDMFLEGYNEYAEFLVGIELIDNQ